MFKEQNIKIGDVYMMNFQGNGSVQRGWRPGIVYQNNVGNRFSSNIIAIPLTTRLKKISQVTHIFLTSSECGLKQDSVALCENPTTMSKRDIGAYITTLPDKIMKKIVEGNLLATSSIAFLDESKIISLIQAAKKLNRRLPCVV